MCLGSKPPVRAGKAQKVDRTGWPKGPWDDEPDRLDFKTGSGYPALALRHPSGHWCGYVAVPPGHPAYNSTDEGVVDVHGGVTYASTCAGHVCHVPEPGEPADVFWLGFDCAHAWDVSPSPRFAEFSRIWAGDERTAYRDLAFVRAECERMGQQLKTMTGTTAEVPPAP